jgi:hypothetical protein
LTPLARTPSDPDAAGRALRWTVVEVIEVIPFPDAATPPEGVARGVRGVAVGADADGIPLTFSYGPLVPVVGRRALLAASDGAAPHLEDLLPEDPAP